MAYNNDKDVVDVQEEDGRVHEKRRRQSQDGSQEGGQERVELDGARAGELGGQQREQKEKRHKDKKHKKDRHKERERGQPTDDVKQLVHGEHEQSTRSDKDRQQQVADMDVDALLALPAEEQYDPFEEAAAPPEVHPRQQHGVMAVGGDEDRERHRHSKGSDEERERLRRGKSGDDDSERRRPAKEDVSREHHRREHGGNELDERRRRRDGDDEQRDRRDRRDGGEDHEARRERERRAGRSSRGAAEAEVDNDARAKRGQSRHKDADENKDVAGARRRQREVEGREERRRRSHSADTKRNRDGHERDGRERDRHRTHERSRSPRGTERERGSRQKSSGGGNVAASVTPVGGEAAEPPKQDVDFAADLTAEEVQMMMAMGIPFGFDTTQGREVVDEASNLSAIKVKSTRQARQYMNRRGGFNRALPAEVTGVRTAAD